MGTDAIRYTLPWLLGKNSDSNLVGNHKFFPDREMKDAQRDKLRDVLTWLTYSKFKLLNQRPKQFSFKLYSWSSENILE